MKKTIVQAGLAALVAVAAMMTGSSSSEAAVYCKYVGYPKGCVVRAGVVLAPRPVVVAPAVVVAPPPVVYCRYVGYPRGCVTRAGVVLRPAPRGVVIVR